MKPDRRTAFVYRGVAVSPERGEPRYFGYGRRNYLRRWWLVFWQPSTWLYVGTKREARRVIDRAAYGPKCNTLDSVEV